MPCDVAAPLVNVPDGRGLVLERLALTIPSRRVVIGQGSKSLVEESIGAMNRLAKSFSRQVLPGCVGAHYVKGTGGS